MGKPADEPEAPPPLPDAPAGGLDVPETRPLSAEDETFPGEGSLTDDERNRWLILHFALPRTIMTMDAAEGRSTEAELNDVLTEMAWGTIDGQTREWTLECEEPSLERAHESQISYAEFVARCHPTDSSVDDATREENAILAGQKRAAFTHQGEPGSTFRPMFEAMVKALAHSTKPLMKAYDIRKAILNEDELPEDPNRSDAQNIMRFGRHQILPSFWQLLVTLTKKKRRFSVVFRTYSWDQLAVVQHELGLFCEGKHPAYDGKNKTQKPPLMDGQKGSRDMRLTQANVGNCDRFRGCLEFNERSSAPPKEQDAEPTGEPTDDVAKEAFKPTVYNFPPYHEAYAGLQHQILDGANTAAILDDMRYWNTKDRQATAGKLLLVDHGGGVAETEVQHVFFDGSMKPGDAHCVDVREAVSGEPIPYKDADGLFLHRVNPYEAVTDPDYFVKALDSCEVNMSKRILESRKVSEAAATAAKEVAAAEAAEEKLPPKEWLYQNIIPALLPALEAAQRDRPVDPIEFIAFYMLRHSKQYSKTLKS
jgi:hypothetical protein